jgi:hypothetical protein
VLIRPVVTYGSETWILSIRFFERKILRKIYGPNQDGDVWGIISSEELHIVINREDIVKFIKVQRIRWLGHVKMLEWEQCLERLWKEDCSQEEEKEEPV